MIKITSEEVYNMIKKPMEDIPLAFLQFSEKQKAPFMAWGRTGSDSVYADMQNAVDIWDCYLDLYTKEHDEDKINTIQKMFRDNNIAYVHETEMYVEKIKLYLFRWAFQIIGG